MQGHYLVMWQGTGLAPFGPSADGGGCWMPRGLYPQLDAAVERCASSTGRGEWPIRVYPVKHGPTYGEPDTAGNARVFGPDGLAFGRLVGGWWYTSTKPTAGAAVRFKLPA